MFYLYRNFIFFYILLVEFVFVLVLILLFFFFRGFLDVVFVFEFGEEV